MFQVGDNVIEWLVWRKYSTVFSWPVRVRRLTNTIDPEPSITTVRSPTS